MGVITDEQFLAARKTIRRAIESLPAASPPRAASPEAIALASRLGEAWDEMTPQERATFLGDWFSELRIGPSSGPVEFVARDAYFPIVAAALPVTGVRNVGSTGLEPVTSAMSTLRSNQLS